MARANSAAFQYDLEPGRTIRGNIHYARSENPEATVVVIHGFKGFKDWGMFPYVAESLSKEFDVVRFNLSRNGVGASFVDFDELDKFARQTFSGDMEDIHDVVCRVAEGRLPTDGSRQPVSKRIVLLGHSRGGGEAFVYALDHPDRVAGLVSWNGSVRFEGMFVGETLRAMKEEGVGYVENARTKEKMPLERIILEDLEANKERFDLVGRVGGLQVPAVIVQGTNDHPVLLSGTELLTAANPSVQWIRITGGDHTFCSKHPFASTTDELEAALLETMKAFRSMLV